MGHGLEWVWWQVMLILWTLFFCWCRLNCLTRWCSGLGVTSAQPRGWQTKPSSLPGFCFRRKQTNKSTGDNTHTPYLSFFFTWTKFLHQYWLWCLWQIGCILHVVLTNVTHHDYDDDHHDDLWGTPIYSLSPWETDLVETTFTFTGGFSPRLVHICNYLLSLGNSQ